MPDRREISHRWYESFDEKSMTVTVAISHSDMEKLEARLGPATFNKFLVIHGDLDYEGTWYQVRVPVKYEVCSTCDGRGSHVNPSIDSNGLSAEDFDEDPDFRENYISGMYDVPCAACKGTRVEPIIAESDENSPAGIVCGWAFDQMQAYYDDQAEQWHERRMGLRSPKED